MSDGCTDGTDGRRRTWWVEAADTATKATTTTMMSRVCRCMHYRSPKEDLADAEESKHPVLYKPFSFSRFSTIRSTIPSNLAVDPSTYLPTTSTSMLTVCPTCCGQHARSVRP